MDFKKLFFLGFFILLSAFAFSQNDTLYQEVTQKYDTTYRVNYANKMICKLNIDSDINNIYIRKVREKSENKFIPNEIFKLRFSFDYRFLGLTVSFSPSFFPGNNDNAIKGNTLILDLGFKFFYSDRLRQEIIYKNVQGYYLVSPNNDELIEAYPHMKVNTYGGKTFFIVNRNFSYRAYESQTERQMKSVGSFIPSVYYAYNTLETNAENTTRLFIDKIYSYDLILQAGYMYNLVLDKKWFATAGFHPGIGYNHSKNFYQNNQSNLELEQNSQGINFNIDANVALGFNNSNFFSGFKANYRSFNYINEVNTEFINTRIGFDFFIGYRFKESKPVKKVFEKIEKQLDRLPI